MSGRHSAEIQLPDGWWGPAWATPHRRSLRELVATGLLDVRAAALLRLLVSSGRPVTIAAGPSGAGKTTLLTSLLPDIPPERRIIFTKGLFHPLAAFSTEPERTTLLVNEISPHLPIYAWGDALRAILDAGSRGAQVLATTHAESPEELVFQLSSYPLRLPPAAVAALGSVAFIDLRAGANGLRRSVTRIVQLSRSGDGVAVEPLTVPATGEVDERALERVAGPGASLRLGALAATHAAAPPAPEPGPPA